MVPFLVAERVGSIVSFQSNLVIQFKLPRQILRLAGEVKRSCCFASGSSSRDVMFDNHDTRDKLSAEDRRAVCASCPVNAPDIAQTLDIEDLIKLKLGADTAPRNSK